MSSQQENTIGFSEGTNLYSILNLENDASIKDIEKQYRSIARQLHPDK